MRGARDILFKLLVGAQCLGAAALIAVLPLAPVAGAPLLLVPLSGAAATGLAGGAIDGGGLILAAGPLPGTIVVRGDAARLRRALGTGVLVLAANPAICGGGK